MRKLLLLILLNPVICFGFGSNFDYSGYPEFSKQEPSQPYRNSDRWMYESYKDEVEQYVNDAKEYIRNADNDIQSIEEAKQDALRKANRVIQEYNNL